MALVAMSSFSNRGSLRSRGQRGDICPLLTAYQPLGRKYDLLVERALMAPVSSPQNCDTAVLLRSKARQPGLSRFLCALLIRYTYC